MDSAKTLMSDDLSKLPTTTSTYTASTDTNDSEVTAPETTVDVCEQDNSDKEGHGTSQMLDSTHPQLEDTVRELKNKLDEIQKRAEQEKLEREKLEEEVRMSKGDFALPVIYPTMPPREDRYRPGLRRRGYYQNDSSEDEDLEYYNPRMIHSHRKKMIRMFRRELQYLTNEEEMIERLRDERNRLAAEEKEWEHWKNQRRSPSIPAGSVRITSAGREDIIVQPQSENEQTSIQEVIPTPPTSAIPKMNYVEWALFKLCLAKEEKESFAIDVLKGEPVVTFDYMTNTWWSKRNRRTGNSTDKTKERDIPVKARRIQRQQPLEPGQPPLPERIRIHSKHILKILEKIHGDALSSDDGPVVMIRPYRALAYYQEQIQQKFQELKTQFSVETIEEAANNSLSKADGTVTDGTTAVGTNGVLNSNAVEDQKQDILAKEDGEEDQDTTSSTAFQHLQCLVDFMDVEIQAKIRYLGSDRCQKVAFTDIWYLFSPGDEVVGQHRRQAYRVLSVTWTGHKVIPPWRNWDKSSAKSEETPVILNCVYIDFDGKQLGPVAKRVEIPRFDGEKSITSLEVYPLRFAEDRSPSGRDGEEKKTFREKLIARGKMFLDCAGVKHVSSLSSHLSCCGALHDFPSPTSLLIATLIDHRCTTTESHWTRETR